MTLRQTTEYSGYAEFLRYCGLKKENLVSPVFASEKKSEIDLMPGLTISQLDKIDVDVQAAMDKGINAIVLFGIPTRRTPDGRDALANQGIVQRAIRKIRSAFGSQVKIITDVCLCQYNTTGHCGTVDSRGRIDNDATLRILADIAASHAEAGADIVAPSAMMDGQVFAIRSRLDDLGLQTRILSYSAKHSSSLYTPFRAAAFASPRNLDKSSYQVSYANPRQAMREIESDIDEGADIVMIKPALAYLDLIRRAKDRFDIPIAAQNVSGEYAMIKAAGSRGMIDEEIWKVHTLGSIRRAGADMIISYFALDIANYL
jgi:porphobilinogen synthase